MNAKIPITVLDYFEETTNEHFNKTAIKTPDDRMTYGKLQETARRLGYALNRTMAGAVNSPVIVFMDKGCDCLAAMLGVLYSGNCYVPMDVKTPGDRLKAIVETLNTDKILVSERDREKLERTGCSCDILIYEQLLESVVMDSEAEKILSDIRGGVIDTDLMYILFTSGSTGIPKGVAIRHRSVIDYVRAFLQEVPISAEDVVGNQVPFYVDMSLKDIYMSLAVGATICVIPQKYFMMPKKVLEYLDENNVTMLMWVPTAYGIVAQFKALDKISPQSLKKFLFSGEAMPIPVYRYWRQMYPEAVWIQQYGPTEITGACTSFCVERVYEDTETIPIGKPFSNTGIILLNEKDEKIPGTEPDTVGEICVYGTCLAAGYYNNPEKTKTSFVQNPLVKEYPSLMYRTGDLAKYDEEGNLIFVSRKDYQIKHGGRRIELGEIETAFYSVPGVKNCCCVHDAGNDIIVLYYVGEIEEKELRNDVKDKLPPYMIPGRYIKKEELPKLANGKLDRKKMTQEASGQR